MSVYCTCLWLLLAQLCALGAARSAEWSGIKFRSDYKFSHEAAGWLKLHRVPLDWHTARVQCYHEGAVLASPLDAKLWSALTKVLTKANLGSKYVYSGVSATFNDGVYSSVEGFPLEQLYIKWAKGQPNNRNRQQCLAYYWESKKLVVVDKDCTGLSPYVCYRSGSITDKVTECGTVDKEYKLEASTGHCYKYHAQAHALPWTLAARVCQAEGGYLADVNSQREANLLVDMFENKTHSINKSTSASVGFRMWGDKSWWTIHGKRLDESGYSLWHEGEPNSSEGPEQCGSIVLATGTLDDVSCDQPHAFICEKHPDSLLNLDGVIFF